MKAVLKNYRQSPRKVRQVADLVRGKNADQALAILSHIQKRAAEPFAKLIRSAIANAQNRGVDTDGLYLKTVTVDEGTVFKRFRARARGAAAGIKKRNSHINIELGTRTATSKK